MVWCNFNISWSPCHPVFGEMGKLPQILPNLWRYPHSASCHNQTAEHLKTGKRDNRATFWWKIHKSRFTHFEEPWRTRWGYRALAMEYHATAALYIALSSFPHLLFLPPLFPPLPVPLFLVCPYFLRCSVFSYFFTPFPFITHSMCLSVFFPCPSMKG